MIFLVTFLAFGVIMAAMAIGVMLGRAPIAGSCGGIGRLGIEQKCEICGDDPNRCESQSSTGANNPGVGTFDPRG